ncbi:hypothetical protein J6590_061599 [Homalodisca vitripennis]|nr:hypothetical protein J6590_061599 [Homalodisca vitripennis]
MPRIRWFLRDIICGAKVNDGYAEAPHSSKEQFCDANLTEELKRFRDCTTLRFEGGVTSSACLVVRAGDACETLPPCKNNPPLNAPLVFFYILPYFGCTSAVQEVSKSTWHRHCAVNSLPKRSGVEFGGGLLEPGCCARVLRIHHPASTRTARFCNTNTLLICASVAEPQTSRPYLKRDSTREIMHCQSGIRLTYTDDDRIPKPKHASIQRRDACAAAAACQFGLPSPLDKSGECLYPRPPAIGRSWTLTRHRLGRRTRSARGK